MSPKNLTTRARESQRVIFTTACFIVNLHCPSCVQTIHDSLSALHPAPEDITVSIVAHSVTVRHSRILSVAEILNSLDATGFEVHSVFQGDRAVYESKKDPARQTVLELGSEIKQFNISADEIWGERTKQTKHAQEDYSFGKMRAVQGRRRRPLPRLDYVGSQGDAVHRDILEDQSRRRTFPPIQASWPRTSEQHWSSQLHGSIQSNIGSVRNDLQFMCQQYHPRSKEATLGLYNQHQSPYEQWCRGVHWQTQSERNHRHDRGLWVRGQRGGARGRYSYSS